MSELNFSDLQLPFKVVATELLTGETVILSDDVALDGAEFVLGNTMWFGSVRAGNLGEIDVYTSQYKDGVWKDVENVGSQLNVDYDIGEFHITADGNTMYFHSGRWDAGDNKDIWITHSYRGGGGESIRARESARNARISESRRVDRFRPGLRERNQAVSSD